jgi:hypothetical protein
MQYANAPTVDMSTGTTPFGTVVAVFGDAGDSSLVWPGLG